MERLMRTKSKKTSTESDENGEGGLVRKDIDVIFRSNLWCFKNFKPKIS